MTYKTEQENTSSSVSMSQKQSNMHERARESEHYQLDRVRLCLIVLGIWVCCTVGSLRETGFLNELSEVSRRIFWKLF
jgi:hypothetical protein